MSDETEQILTPPPPSNFAINLACLHKLMFILPATKDHLSSETT